VSRENRKSHSWLWLLIAGLLLVAAGQWAIEEESLIKALLLGVGGLMVVFASSEMMIEAVDGFARRKKMNAFVAGTLAGLSSNIPELVMLGFVLLATPRVGFIVTVLTLHVGAAAFGLYSALLPRDLQGNASLPRPLVGLSTDLYAAAAGVFFSLGVIMLLMKAFEPASQEDVPLEATDPKAPMTLKAIFGFGTAGLLVSIIGGHSVGEFAGILVHKLETAGYSEMLGAVILSLFSAAGAFIMIGTAHAQKKYSIAMANASGAITQVPFLVLPIAMILLAAFTQTGLIPSMDGGNGVIPIDIHTTSAILLGFPSMLVLWKAVQDDGKVNWVETSTMIAIFLLVIYLLVAHG